jgi:hypothetical protein
MKFFMGLAGTGIAALALTLILDSDPARAQKQAVPQVTPGPAPSPAPFCKTPEVLQQITELEGQQTVLLKQMRRVAEVEDEDFKRLNDCLKHKREAECKDAQKATDTSVHQYIALNTKFRSLEQQLIPLLNLPKCYEYEPETASKTRPIVPSAPPPATPPPEGKGKFQLPGENGSPYQQLSPDRSTDDHDPYQQLTPDPHRKSHTPSKKTVGRLPLQTRKSFQIPVPKLGRPDAMPPPRLNYVPLPPPPPLNLPGNR